MYFEAVTELRVLGRFHNTVYRKDSTAEPLKREKKKKKNAAAEFKTALAAALPVYLDRKSPTKDNSDMRRRTTISLPSSSHSDATTDFL